MEDGGEARNVNGILGLLCRGTLPWPSVQVRGGCGRRDTLVRPVRSLPRQCSMALNSLNLELWVSLSRSMALNSLNSLDILKIK